MPEKTPEPPPPLEGIRVLDLTHIVAGPFCTMVLGDAGAEVIKVEQPGVGDRRRAYPPFLTEGGREPVSYPFLSLNRNKRSITLNLKHPRGKALFRELLKVSDVLVENLGPGAMGGLGLDYEAAHRLNPSLVYASISGFGQREDLKGPYWDWSAHNPTVQAMSGLMEITGEPEGPPAMVGAPIGDTIPALWTAYGILLALHSRNRTGLGQHLDMALYDCMVVHNGSALAYYNATGKSPTRRREDMSAATIALKAKDGYVTLSGSRGREKWSRLWKRAGREELIQDSRFLGEGIRGPFFLGTIKPTIEEWSKDVPKRELARTLEEMGFASGPVQNAEELARCPQLQARRMIMEFDHPYGKRFIVPGNPIKFSQAPEAPRGMPPALGEHNHEVFSGLLGLPGKEVEDLREEGVV